jgi:hypothetical protein
LLLFVRRSIAEAGAGANWSYLDLSPHRASPSFLSFTIPILKPQLRRTFHWSLRLRLLLLLHGGCNVPVDLDQLALAVRAPIIRGRPFQLSLSLMLFLASV